MEMNVSCPHCGNTKLVSRPSTRPNHPFHWHCPTCGESSRNPTATLGPTPRTNFAVGLAMVVGFFTVLVCYLILS
jgi:uncharacterized protein (DUF983 family)